MNTFPVGAHSKKLSCFPVSSLQTTCLVLRSTISTNILLLGEILQRDIFLPSIECKLIVDSIFDIKKKKERKKL